MLTDRLKPLKMRFGSLTRRGGRETRSESEQPRARRVVSTGMEDMVIPTLGLQMDYTVSAADTLERIAALHDCTVGELMKLNRMHSRMVFSGQKILVPLPSADEVFMDAPAPSNNDRVRGPGGAVPVQLTSTPMQRGPLAKTQSVPARSEAPADEADTDCLQRFLKIKVKQVTESDGTVSGTLLVTPNCLMFDPDVTHPLVKEKGQDLYGMVANMDEIMSVSVYKDIEGLTGDKAEKKKDIFDPEHVRTPAEKEDPKEVEEQREEAPEDPVHKRDSIDQLQPPDRVRFSNSMSEDEVNEDHSGTPSLQGSQNHLPSIDEEMARVHGEGKEVSRERASSELVGEGADRRRSPSSCSSGNDERPRANSELQAGATGFSRYSPNAARRSFGKLGRTLSARAKSIQGTVTSGAQTVAAGTKTVAHGVVTHTKSAADTLHTGIQSGAKVMTEGVKTTVDAVTSVPSHVVNMGSAVLENGVGGVVGGVSDMCDQLFAVEEQRSPTQLKREQSLATLEGLRQRTQQARNEASKSRDNMFSCATSSDEMPELFKPVSEMIKSTSEEDATNPQLPYYMAVRLTRKKRGTKSRSSIHGHSLSSEPSDDCAFGNKLKREFWFAVPRTKADHIYNFLLQWNPEKYGQDTTSSTLDDSNSFIAIPANDPTKEGGFIILDSCSSHDQLAGEKPASVFGASYLNREWEMVTVQEMCRRLSLDQDELEMPIPEGASTSTILDELMIRQIMEILPARAEGYPWVQIYNSEKNGFSLATLYRKMVEFDEDLSPVLLIIRDTKERVFGCVVSSAIRPNDHYYGTGDSCLLWRFTGEAPHTRELRHYNWTGNNQFFVNAAKDALSVGAGRGHYGLWLDADLNHGRSQRCDTFDNEPLCGDREDFIVQQLEAYGFRI